MINEQLNARDHLLARLYKELRVEDESNELRQESLDLYNEVKKSLIETIRVIYENDIEEQKRRLEEIGCKKASGKTDKEGSEIS